MSPQRVTVELLNRLLWCAKTLVWCVYQNSGSTVICFSFVATLTFEIKKFIFTAKKNKNKNKFRQKEKEEM